MTTRNLLFTFYSVLLWAVLLVTSRLILFLYEIDPWAFTFIQLISGGLLLIGLSTGGQAVDWGTIRRPQTWLYGIFRITTSAAFTAALVHISVVYTGFIGSIKVVLGLFGVWFFFGRRPSRWELPGVLPILIGVALLITYRLTGSWANPAVILMAISEVAVVSATLVAEKHPDNNAADPRARLRFTGVVLVITAAFFLLLRVGQTLWLGGEGVLMGVQLSLPLWLAGLTVGVLLRGPAMHTSLKAIRLVGSEIYLMMTQLLPFIGWGFEWLMSALGLMPTPPNSVFDLLLGLCIASGTIYIFATRFRAS